MAGITAIRQSFPRRVVSYYLLFSLVTIAWLVVFAVMVTRSVIESGAESASLTRLSRAATQCEVAYVRHGAASLQAEVARVARENGFVYCAIVGPDGVYMAHSDRRRSGAPSPRRAGRVEPLGDIMCVHYVGADGRGRRQYQIPLRAGDEAFGTLEIAITEPNALAMILRKADLVPLALLVPLGLITGGVFVLRRLARPVAEIEARLRQIASAPSSAAAASLLDAVPVRGAASVGWNRLVRILEESTRSGDLRQRIDQALQRRTEARFDQFLNTLPEGIAASDARGRITFANDAFRALLGTPLDPDQNAEAAVERWLERADVEPDCPLRQPELATRAVVTELKRGNGSEDRFLRVARFPVRANGAEAPEGYVWSVRDVTQQKLAERTRDEFLDSATHELRTPLANIKAYAETLVLSEMLDVEQQKEFCNTINAEATRLTRLIDDLLSVASMEAGSLVITRDKVELGRLLQEIISKTSAQMEQKKITFETILSPKLPELEIDKDKIATALVNLVGNAAKYTPEHGRVALKAYVADDNVVIDVEDSGIGIAEEELPKIFNRFFRSDDQRVRDVTGTGLGLALAHEVIKLHGGTIAVQSVLNEGSTFTVTLPIEP